MGDRFREVAVTFYVLRLASYVLRSTCCVWGCAFPSGFASSEEREIRDVFRVLSWWASFSTASAYESAEGSASGASAGDSQLQPIAKDTASSRSSGSTGFSRQPAARSAST